MDGLIQEHKAVNEWIDFSADDADDVIHVSCPTKSKPVKLTVFPIEPTNS